MGVSDLRVRPSTAMRYFSFAVRASSRLEDVQDGGAVSALLIGLLAGGCTKTDPLYCKMNMDDVAHCSVSLDFHHDRVADRSGYLGEGREGAPVR